MRTVKLGDGTKSLSQAKLDQLAQARVKSLEVRRRAQKAKLEGKLSHLRSMLGSDMRPDTVERVAKEMIAADDRHAAEVARLREKQVETTREINDTLVTLKDEMRSLRKTFRGSTPLGSLSGSVRKGVSSEVSVSSTKSR